MVSARWQSDDSAWLINAQQSAWHYPYYFMFEVLFFFIVLMEGRLLLEVPLRNHRNKNTYVPSRAVKKSIIVVCYKIVMWMMVVQFILLH